MKENNKILKTFQSFKENDLTKTIIIPTIQNMGYTKVEFFGGTTEHGKDIVIWDIDRLDDVNLIVAQVKHFKFTNTAAGNKSIQTVINQISTCLNKSLLYNEKQSYLPKEVWLISTYIIDTATLHTYFDTFPTLRDQRIKIIDGDKLINLVSKYNPDVIKKLFGTSKELSSSLKHKFNNDLLITALGGRSVKDIKTIYSDIDFSLGKLSTTLFFNSKLDSKKGKLELTLDEWEIFKSISKSLAEIITLDFLIKGIQEIENDHAHINNEYLNIQYEIINLKDQITNYENKLHLFNKNRDSNLKNLNEIQHYKSKIQTQRNKLKYEKKPYKHLQEELMSIKEQENTSKNTIEGIKIEIDNEKSKITEINSRIELLNINRGKLLYKFRVDGERLSENIIELRHWIQSNISKYNKIKPTSTELRVFLQKCSAIINSVSKIFDNENSKFFSFLGINRDVSTDSAMESTRFSLPIEQVFDTGLNIFVLGDGGAGKSTSLEMYAWNRRNGERTIIQFPLGSVAQLYYLNATLIGNIIEGDNFEHLLNKYIDYSGVRINLDDFKKVLLDSNTTLLFDGLDEAIKILPLLPITISNLSQKYPKCQIILSSRMQGIYIHEIQFFTITLLPFTQIQRDTFIAKWFEGNVDSSEIVKRVNKHLETNPIINEIVRNPLLTTTLCILAENKVILPRTEIKLYDERLRLFTGYYDRIKKIPIRITTTPNILENLAQKIAFKLHSTNKRSEHLNIIREYAHKTMINLIDSELIDIAVDELINPCEILIPMTFDGKYGFGHLRFQEHLAARELLKRNVDILPIIRQHWWEGPLLLFARMNEDLEWLIRLLGDKGKIMSPILNKIIATRNSIEKEKLLDLIQKYRLIKTGDLLGDNELIDTYYQNPEFNFYDDELFRRFEYEEE